MSENKILLEHGDGGLLTGNLISEVFLPRFQNPYLNNLGDGAVCEIGGQKICLSTDSYVVNPIFFPGGDIGSLAVHGTVNDLAMCAATPLFLSAGFILEEGFAMENLERITQSMARAAAMAGVAIVTGDTKVVPKGAADKIFINTAGVGKVAYPSPVNVSSIKPGDVLIVNGTIGDHGAAILSIREGLELGSSLVSDSAPLNGLVKDILEASPHIHCLRDATRGGLGGIMVEIAKQAGLQLNIDEQEIPLREGVRGICEVMGFDPLFLANEGKMLTVCGVEDAEAVLAVMRKHEFGKDAAIIGSVSKNDRGRCIVNTIIGSSREIDLPTGELVPRIC